MLRPGYLRDVYVAVKNYRNRCSRISGQSSIKDQCPVCDHSPLSPDLCKPSKAVRTTAKAYLKTAEKKLADERLKGEANAAPTAASAPSKEPATPDNGKIAEPRAASMPVAEPDRSQAERERDEADRPQPSIEVGPDASLGLFKADHHRQLLQTKFQIWKETVPLLKTSTRAVPG